MRIRRDQTIILALGMCGISAAFVFSSSCAPPRPTTDGGPTARWIPSESRALASSPAGGEAVETVADILSREPWRYATAEGEVIRTTNYRLYTTAKDKVIRDRLATFQEHALSHYRQILTPLPAPATKLDTYLMDNRPQWERMTKQLMGDRAEALLKIPRGGYASRGIGVFYNIGLFDTLAIAGHEGWHQFTQKTFAEPLPSWLEEGLATFMEGHRWEQNTPVFRPWANVQRFDQLRKAEGERKLLALEDLLDSRPQDFLDFTDERVLTFYAQLWALVHFLNEGEGGKYAAALREVMTDAAEGRLASTVRARLGGRAGASVLTSRSGPTVFMAYFSEDLSPPAEEYARFVSRLTRPGSRSAIAEGRSPSGLEGR